MIDRNKFPGNLNAGRERRSGAILDDISEKLEVLERKISGENRSAQSRQDHATPYTSAQRARKEPSRNSRNRFGELEREIVSARGHTDNFNSISTISNDLHLLREELRREMSQGIRSEFNELRDQLASIYQDVRSGANSQDMARELDQIAHAVSALSERTGDREVQQLRNDVDDLRAAVKQLAREETVQSVHERWDDFDRRWDSIATHIADGVDATGRADAMFGRLSDRMEAISDALSEVPSRAAMASLEDKVRTLTDVVGQIADQQHQVSPDLFNAVEERLDEISRAIVASSASGQNAQIDPSQLERIEARVSSLATQIHEVISHNPSEFIDHLNVLNERVNAIAQDRGLPDEALERIGMQITALADRLEDAPAPPDMGIILEGVEGRIQDLATLVQDRTHDVSRQSLSMFKDLEGRLSDLGERIGSVVQPADDERSALFSQDIETRFSQLNTRLDESSRKQSATEEALMRAFEERFRNFEQQISEVRSEPVGMDAEAIENIEQRLDAISSRLESGTANVHAMEHTGLSDALEARLEDIAARLEETSRSNHANDRALIENLENQVSEMSRYMANPAQTLPELENLSPRLAEIEKALSTNNDALLQTAQKAAEDALRAASIENSEHREAVSALAKDLKALDALTRRSEDRNAKTFEAIHETLLKIVDRLSSLESSEEQAALAKAVQPAKAETQAKAKIEVAQTPALDVEDDYIAPATQKPQMRSNPASGRMSPSEAAAAAAFAALDDSGVDADDSSAIFGNLDKANVDSDGGMASLTPPVLDDGFDDAPLLPGEEQPDLDAIMNRVRTEKAASQSSDADAAKADFIMAARRAAQAAASEAEVLKSKAGNKEKGARSGLAGILRDKRKPILMAAGAVMILLAGLRVGSMLLSSDDAVIAEDSTQISESSHTADIPVRQAVPSEEDDSFEAAPEEEPAAMEITEEPAAFGEDTDEVPPDQADDLSASEQAAAENVTTDLEPASISFGPVALREAVARLEPKALFEVGNRYAEGRGVQASAVDAAQWYQRSAEAGYPIGQYRYASLLEKGTGVERDIKAAKTWYQMAAQQGNASAMHNLAVLFASGVDGQPDNDSAVRWFVEAAEMGVKDSQFNLGILAAKGVGMPQDLLESYKWFAIAARNGDKDAAEKRDEVAKALRPEQLDRARAKADLWKPREVNAEANLPDIPAEWTEAKEVTASVDMKKAVRNIQLILNKNGFDAGTPDGIMGGKTKQAIMAFQKANGLPATGEVDNQLINKLLEKK